MKERLVGAAVLVILAVIFIPMFLDDSTTEEISITKSNIPPKPETLPESPAGDGDFSSRIIPLQQKPAGGKPVTDEPESPAQSAQIENLSEDEGNAADDSGTPAAIEKDDSPINDVGLSAWVVQLGSFSSKENADSLNKKLREDGYRSFVEPVMQDNSTVYRVRVGPELKREAAESIKDKLSNALDLKGIVVEYP